MLPFCSIVIATHNRSASLRRTLESVLHQHFDAPYEVIVVDNGSSDDTAVMVAEYLRRYAFLRYVFEPTPGPAAARNTGVNLANGDVIAFTDDDITPSASWLGQIARTFVARADIDCCGGRILPAWPERPPAWLTKQHWTGALALQDYGKDSFVIDAARPLSLATANLAVHRRTLLAFGGFATEYRYAEDTELLLRLWRAGRRCFYVPDIVVVSDVQPERMRKAYHRDWHRRHGEWAARMGLEESFDGLGHLRDYPARAPRLYGVQGFLYRKWLTTMLGYLAAMATLRFARAFEQEKQLWQLTAYIRTCAADRTRRPRRPPITEVAQFAAALARKKLSWRRTTAVH